MPHNTPFVESMPGFVVKNKEYLLVAFESLDHDFLTRRPGPLVIRSSKGYVDISNGPRNYQWCNGYPCNLRPAIYYVMCAVGKFMFNILLRLMGLEELFHHYLK